MHQGEQVNLGLVFCSPAIVASISRSRSKRNSTFRTIFFCFGGPECSHPVPAVPFRCNKEVAKYTTASLHV